MHLVDVATRMQLKSTGQVATCVPFVYQQKQKMTLYKGDAALETRRAVASKLSPSLITARQRPRRVDDKADWAPMQQLYDAGLSYDPVSAMPVFDPSLCAPALLKALWPLRESGCARERMCARAVVRETGRDGPVRWV